MVLIALAVAESIKHVVTVKMILGVDGVMILQTLVLESAVKVATMVPGMSAIVDMTVNFYMKGGSLMCVQVCFICFV